MHCARIGLISGQILTSPATIVRCYLPKSYQLRRHRGPNRPSARAAARSTSNAAPGRDVGDTGFISWLMRLAGQEGQPEVGAAPCHSRPEGGRVQAATRLQDGMERRHVACRATVPHQPDVSGLGGGGAVRARAPPLQQQAAPSLTKSRISSDWRASSEIVALQGNMIQTDFIWSVWHWDVAAPATKAHAVRIWLANERIFISRDQ